MQRAIIKTSSRMTADSSRRSSDRRISVALSQRPSGHVDSKRSHMFAESYTRNNLLGKRLLYSAAQSARTEPGAAYHNLHSSFTSVRTILSAARSSDTDPFQLVGGITPVVDFDWAGDESLGASPW
jgi:hypothetical protein